MIQFLKFVILLLISSSLFGCSSTSDKTEKITAPIEKDQDLSIIETTDVHYFAPSLTDNGAAFKQYVAAGDGKQLAYSDEITDAFLEDVEAKKTDVLIISGDLTNNGEKTSHEELAKKLAQVEKAGTQVFVVPGNHDINNPWARKFEKDKQLPTDTITPTDFSKIYGDFGYKDAISSDDFSLSYLAAPSSKVWLLMLDTAIYKTNMQQGTPTTEGGLTTGTLDWVKECSTLAEKNGAKLIPVMHHNLTNHSDVIQRGFTINYNQQVIDTLTAGNMEFSLSGHIHTQNIRTAKSTDGKEITDIVTNALSVYPHKYGNITYSAKNKNFTYQSQKLDIESWAKEHGKTDKNLLNFDQFDYDTFYNSGYDKAIMDLMTSDAYKTYSQSDKEKMADTMGLNNMYFFAGTAPPKSAGMALWDSAPNSFLKDYVLSTSNPPKNSNDYYVSP
ncbi:metallophosphoesterase [Listeria welshimeri]|uniref:Serine/threonine protein phosphatase family protein n=1 Tax=Listeria welshimeri serovar 6b (strain ATCC 35897 / DSM 20650 / CCUG 15529 / CIP 8149 / NCTC 11857 / SLCC 5334 / V8) TaxID=386043 RepID=A0ALX8_LISW6|nr:metallophosphoesterase [Listeria welshimeri]CAK22010.1 serine/threonine protein phosphatase family protein [Listeria welshimeri serovar 6b str. SLCC5334]SNV29946.1 cyclic 3',5'-adenosine monophosphate phosphodiesterase [Listeria welshimeri]